MYAKKSEKLVLQDIENFLRIVNGIPAAEYHLGHNIVEGGLESDFFIREERWHEIKEEILDADRINMPEYFTGAEFARFDEFQNDLFAYDYAYKSGVKDIDFVPIYEQATDLSITPKGITHKTYEVNRLRNIKRLKNEVSLANDLVIDKLKANPFIEKIISRLNGKPYYETANKYINSVYPSIKEIKELYPEDFDKLLKGLQKEKELAVIFFYKGVAEAIYVHLLEKEQTGYKNGMKSLIGTIDEVQSSISTLHGYLDNKEKMYIGLTEREDTSLIYSLEELLKRMQLRASWLQIVQRCRGDYLVTSFILRMIHALHILRGIRKSTTANIIYDLLPLIDADDSYDKSNIVGWINKYSNWYKTGHVIDYMDRHGEKETYPREDEGF